MDSYTEMIISDISKLEDRLAYLKEFLNKNPINLTTSISILHTDIQILSNKLKYKEE